jgi:hypothetical protein
MHRPRLSCSLLRFSSTRIASVILKNPKRFRRSCIVASYKLSNSSIRNYLGSSSRCSLQAVSNSIHFSGIPLAFYRKILDNIDSAHPNMVPREFPMNANGIPDM